MLQHKKYIHRMLLISFLVMGFILSIPQTLLRVQATETIETPETTEEDGNKTALQEAIETAESYMEKEADYTLSSFKTFKEALDAAKGVLDNEESENTAIADALNNLNAAIEGLAKKSSNQDLKDAIEKAEDDIGKEAEYTPSTFTKLEEALDAANDIADSATDEEVAQAVKALDDARTGLAKRGDKTELKKAIDEAESKKEEDYVSTTLPKFQTALIDANNTYKDDNATDEDVKKALDALTAATNELVKLGDKTELKKLIDNFTVQYEDAQKKDPDLYTANSYKIFDKAITDARKVFNKKDALQDEVDKAKKALEDSIKTLIFKPRYTLVGNTQYYNLSDFFASDPERLYRQKDNEFFQWALDKAGADHFTEIYVPAGIYYIYDVLLIHSNTTLRLDPNATIIRMDTTKNMLKNSDFNGKCNTVGGYELSQNLVITGGIWDGGIRNASGSVIANTATNLIYLGHANNVTISSTTIRGCNGAHALELASVQNAIVDGCQFYDFARSASNDYFDSEAIELDVCGKSDWTPGYKIDKTICQNITIKNNSITDYPRGVGSHHVLSGHTYDSYQNITVQNNTFNRSSASTQSKCNAAIRLEGIANATIKSNTVKYYYYGIYIKNSSGLTVKKNTLKYNGTSHILYTGCKGVTNQSIKFTITQKKRNTKVAKYKAPTMKTGYLKINGKKYTFKKVKAEQTAKLKKKIKKNQNWQFYGKDKNNNKFFYDYTVK